MKANLNLNVILASGFTRQAAMVFYSLLAWVVYLLPARANPTGGTVAQGAANFNTSGSQLTVNQTSASALINWSSFNIAAGETTTFVQPSSSSVAWNQINDVNPSQIFGNLNANGYVVLQNQNGFYVGGSANLNTHGLVMTTVPTPSLNLSSGGAWQFSTPPPAAKIINYGQINVSGGGSLFLIASDIENRSGVDSAGNNSVGAISAPGGTIGLYAGQQVLVSARSNGLGLSARVTLPQGSVDNEGKLIADAGTILAQAQTVNNNGLVQANSVQNVNGVIELVASGNLSLGANSDLEAHGDNTSASASPGGMVVLQAGAAYADTPTSQINVAGGTGSGGGQAGIVEVFGNNLDGTMGTAGDANSVQSIVGSPFALLLNPYDLTLSQNPTGTSLDANNNLDANFNVNDLAPYTRIDLHALDNIELSAPWSLTDPSMNNPGAWGSLSLQAGNSIILDAGTSISAGNNWEVNLTAGTGFTPTPAQPTPPPGASAGLYSDGVYLNGGAFMQSQNGDINVWAANEVIIQAANVDAYGNILTPSGAIRTLADGSINVTAVAGDVNAGDNFNGYTFGLNGTVYPYYYKVNAANLGGISTAAGGNVTINAGGNVTSYEPTQNDYNTFNSRNDAGTGAFGPEAGNVTINAGGTVVGNYVLANGIGTITAGGDIGVPFTDTGFEGFALSLVKGNWRIYGPNIYLDDVLNPNGVFNDSSSRTGKAGAHYFDYDPQSSLLLDAANAVEITGANVPLLPASDLTGLEIPVLLPPTLQITTGAGGLTLDTDVILFPSAYGNLNITTLNGGNFISRQNPNDPYDVNIYSLQMSDSANRQWNDGVGNNASTEIFGYGDHAPTPPELNNPNPVEITINGNIDNVNIYTTKATELTVNSVTVAGQTVGGNMFNASLVGENLHATDTTFIHVAGSISFSPIYTLTSLTQPIVGANPINPTWDSIFSVLVDYTPGDVNSVANPIPSTDFGNNKALNNLAISDLIFQSATPNPGFVYSPATQQLGYGFQMSSTVRSALESPLKIIVRDSFGNPEVQLGQASLGQDPTQYYFVTTTVSFVPATVIEALYNESHGLNANGTPNPNGTISAKNAQSLAPGFQVGGPGQFNVTAGSLDLGSSGGILSWGVGDGAQSQGGVNYGSLAAALGGAANSGASITVEVTGDIGMLTSTIASLAGGNVTVKSAGGEIDLGLASLPFSPPNAGNLAYGIYTSEGGNVNATADGDVNIDTARIATFNGGSVTVESNNGDVNAGNGVNQDLLIPVVYLDPKTGEIVNTAIQGPRPYGSGIMALSPTKEYQAAGSTGLPGDITVTTPNGNIVSTLGGISQFALDGSVAGGPIINLTAGTVGTPASKTEGNIGLGQGGVIGGTVNLTAQGSISGLIVSRQNSTVNAVHNIDVTVLSGGTANVSAGGAVSGTLIGVSGINASGGAGITATMLSGSVSANGQVAQSTLGNASASSASQSAAQQSSSDTKQQLASNENAGDDDKKKKKMQALLRRIKRVTVLLPKSRGEQDDR